MKKGKLIDLTLKRHVISNFETTLLNGGSSWNTAECQSHTVSTCVGSSGCGANTSETDYCGGGGGGGGGMTSYDCNKQ